MENLIIYIIMSVAGIGALLSGLIFESRNRKIAMQLACMVVFEGMLFLLGHHYE